MTTQIACMFLITRACVPRISGFLHNFKYQALRVSRVSHLQCKPGICLSVRRFYSTLGQLVIVTCVALQIDIEGSPGLYLCMISATV